MKQSIVVVLFVALVCSITQSGFAADVTLRFQGVQIKNMSGDITNVTIRCQLLAAQGGVITGRDKRLSLIVDQNGNRSVNSGPIELYFENLGSELRNIAHSWSCSLITPSSDGSPKKFVVCNPAAPPQGVQAFQCVDSRYFNRLEASGVITP